MDDGVMVKLIAGGMTSKPGGVPICIEITCVSRIFNNMLF